MRHHQLTRNDRWHFSIVVRPGDVGQTMQFSDATADNLFQITAEPYTDLDVALGEEGAAGSASDQPDTLSIVHVFRSVQTHGSERNPVEVFPLNFVPRQ